MAVKRDFGEKQSSELKDKTGLRNQVNAAPGKTENIDNLVDNFLAELSDLSSEINQDGKPGADSDSKSAANAVNEPPRLKSQEEEARKSPDINDIDDEIEKSLTELESLKAGEVAKKAVSLPGSFPEKSAGLKKGEAVQVAKAAPPEDPDAQGWDRLEVFRNQLSSTNASRRRPIGIWAAVLVVAAAIAIFLVFQKEDSPRPPGQSAASESAKSDPGTAGGQPGQPEISAASTNGNKENKENKPANPGAPGQNKNAAGSKSSSRAADNGKGKNERDKASANGSEKQRSEDAPTASPVQKPGTNEETPRQGSSPVPAAKLAAEEAPVAPPPISVVQAKPSPVVTAENNTPAVPADLPPRESAAEPKPAAEVSNQVQTKSRVPVMAEAVKRVSPDYPPIARSQKVSGKVDVEAEISEKGDVVRAKAVSGPILLRNAAEQALMKWKFKPASLDGINVPSKARISVGFNLQ